MRRILVVALFALVPVLTRIPLTHSDTGGGDRSPSGAPDFATSASGFRLLVPSVTRDGPPSEISLSTLAAYQGGAIRVRVSNATTGEVTILGRVSRLTPDGSGGLIGYAGIGTEDPPYGTAMTVAYTASDGRPEVQVRWFSVLKTAWTVDYITIPPPNPNEPPPPPGLVDEQPRLDAIYRVVSARKWTDNWQSPLTPPTGGLIDCARAALGAFPCVSGYFGEQRSFDGGPVQGHHGGSDLAAKEGTPVYSTNDGVVVLAERVLQRGNLVVIDHGGGVFSAYGHMSSFVVAGGQPVTKGQLIGYVGSTGLSTGPHLHWEMAVGGFVVDGLRWLDGSQGF